MRPEVPGASRYAADPAGRQARLPVAALPNGFFMAVPAEAPERAEFPPDRREFRGKSGLPGQAGGRRPPGRRRIPAPRRPSGSAAVEAREAAGGRPRSRPRRRPAPARLVARHLGHQAAEVRRWGYRAGCTGRGRSGRPARRPSRRTRSRRDPPDAAPRHCARPAPRPSAERSTPMPNAAGNSVSAASSRQPVPVPRSSTRRGGHAVGERRERRLDQRLRFGARDQRGGRDGETPGSRTRGGRGSAPAVRAPRAGATSGARPAMSAGAAGSRSRAAGVMPCACASSSRASSRGLSMPACRSRSAARSIALADRVAQAAWLAARFACARSSRRFSALASSVRRPAGVAKQVGVDAALLLDGADGAGGQPHADRLRREHRTAARHPAGWAGSGGGSGCWRG